MPKEQRSMLHPARNEPYPTIMSSTEAPSRSFSVSEQLGAPIGERSSAAWSHDDDERLMQCRAQGMNWGPISTQFPSKTANACRKRHERLMEKKSAESWDGIKIEDLGKAYLDNREAMWRILADAIGEKWQTVEMKCMEKGLKTLQTAGRAARRHGARQGSADHSQHSTEFEDSGLGFPHSPSQGPPSHLNLPNPPVSTLFSQSLAPQPRTGSISSASSANVSIPTPGHHHTPQHQPPQHRFPYSTNHPQLSLYSTAAPSPSSYMATGTYGAMTFSPTATTGYAPGQGLPSLSRFDVPGRTTQPPPLPPLLPSLINTGSRSQQEPITASY